MKRATLAEQKEHHRRAREATDLMWASASTKKIGGMTVNFITAIVAIILLVASASALAQEKTFPIGVVVETQALFCVDKESAQVIADAKGEESPEIEVLIHQRKCFGGIGRGIYVREVYRKGKWSVWEFSVGTRSYFEPTDWRGIRKGGVSI